MKHFLFAACVATLPFLPACYEGTAVITDDTGGNSKNQEQRNINASDVVLKAFQTGEVSGIDSVIADDFVDHTDRGDMKGKDSLKAMVKFAHENFKDMKFEKVRDVADGDYVYSWINYSGTGDGTMGTPKGPYKMATMEVSRFRDGKAVEHWAFVNMQDMVKMMGQPQPEMNKADTGKIKN